MARILRNLKISDVSSVDVGAGRGVRVKLLKKDGDRIDELAALPVSELHAKYQAGEISEGIIAKIGERLEKVGRPSGHIKNPRPGTQTGDKGERGDRNVVASDAKLLGRIADAKVKAIILDIQRKENCSVAEAIAWAGKHGIELPKAVVDMAVRIGGVPGSRTGPLSKFEAEVAKLGGNGTPPKPYHQLVADGELNQEKSKMSKEYCCPKCNFSGPKDMFKPDDGDDDSMEKIAESFSNHVTKTAVLGGEGMIRQALATLKKSNPKASRIDALRAVVDSGAMDELHKAEFAAKQRLWASGGV